MAKEKIAKYSSIATDLAKKIVCGKYEIGEKLSGRTTLASTYNVSPETIRKAIYILKESDIVEINRGSGIIIISVENAEKFLERVENRHTFEEVEDRILALSREHLKISTELIENVKALNSQSKGFFNVSPFIPYEIRVPEISNIINKRIEEINFWNETGATIVAIKKDNDYILSPGPYYLIDENDILVIVCNSECFLKAKDFINLKKELSN